jgi:hypothetical protein
VVLVRGETPPQLHGSSAAGKKKKKLLVARKRGFLQE